MMAGFDVSIRAPREGGDVSRLDVGVERQFQSAPPVKGATLEPSDFKLLFGVSIRAPREGGDRLEGK